MEEILKLFLAFDERQRAHAVSERKLAFDELSEVLPRIRSLTAREWEAVLTEVEEDLHGLRIAERQAVERREQAERYVELLSEYARSAPDHNSHEDQPAEERDEGPRNNAITRAATTWDAILLVMRKRPHRKWTPIVISDELERAGRPTVLSNVQVHLRRMANKGDVEKVGLGTYLLVVNDREVA